VENTGTEFNQTVGEGMAEEGLKALPKRRSITTLKRSAARLEALSRVENLLECQLILLLAALDCIQGNQNGLTPDKALIFDVLAEYAYARLTPDRLEEPGGPLEDYRENFDDMTQTARAFIQRHPDLFREATEGAEVEPPAEDPATGEP
jgi:hypothetical protein